MGFEPDAVTETNFIADDAVWTNETVVTDPGAGANNCGGMNRGRVSGCRHLLLSGRDDAHDLSIRRQLALDLSLTTHTLHARTDA